MKLFAFSMILLLTMNPVIEIEQKKTLKKIKLAHKKDR